MTRTLSAPSSAERDDAKAKRGREEERRGGHAVEDNVFARSPREIVDGLENLIRNAVQFEGGVESDDGVVAEGVGDAVAVERSGGKSAGIDVMAARVFSVGSARCGRHRSI